MIKCVKKEIKKKIIRKNMTKEVKNIIEEFFTKDIVEMNEKRGWLNKVIFENVIFDSHNAAIKIGTRFGPLVKKCAKLKYGENAVPKYIAGVGITQEEAEEYYKNKYKSKKEKIDTIILTRVDKSILESTLLSAEDMVEQYGKLNKKMLYKIYDNYINEIVIGKEILEVNCDLVLTPDGEILIYECKLSGNVDSGKCKSVLIHNMIIPYLITGVRNANIFFGVISSNGALSISKYIGSDNLLVDEVFMKHFLPNKVSPTEFKKMVSKRIRFLKNKIDY